MKLIAISRVKNEVDIIEAFVRHHAESFEKLVIVDDASNDGTYELLLSLQAAGLPLVLMRESAVGYEQSRDMTRLLKMVANHFAADWIIPLDADEFVETREGTTLAEVLRTQRAEILKVAWNNFVWRPEDDMSEPNPVVRMRLRMPPSPDHLDKVLIPARPLIDGIVLAQGNHDLLLNGEILPSRRLDSVALCHFPIRSLQQYAAKIAVGYLQYAATPGWDRKVGFHYIKPFRILSQDVEEFARSATAQSRHYSLSDDWPNEEQPRDAPLRYLGGPLQFVASPKPILANVLHCAEAIANELANQRREHPVSPSEGSARTGSDTRAHTPPVPGSAVDELSINEPASRLTFQSFWAGGPLTPYESLCLTSFVAHGHDVDLYTFDRALVAPPGIHVRDASEVLSKDEFFVYEDGFGKGSPSSFANLFRYKLLTEKGGWWIDTDVVCLSADIPSFGEFFAREDTNLVNGAVLLFEPRHPVMVRCFGEAQRLGRSVRWGDTGPRLLTRVLREHGSLGSAQPSSACYPVHHSAALDLLPHPRSRTD